MEQRMSLITLGISDLARARSFYEALGWTTGAEEADDVVFFQAGGMVLALWDRAKLAEDSVVTDSPGWGGVTLAYNTRSTEEVDRGSRRRARRARRSAGSRARHSGAATRGSSSIPTGTPGRSPTTPTGRSRRTGPSRSQPTDQRRAQ
jgi:catechol 2,3-dioxygenase-like lactoylglutathione lyase family enzyme